MKDKELDALFRRNADYLADEPPRDFDKDAFWRQLQTELPKKEERRKKRAAWWWAAASVLLAATFGGTWWMKSARFVAKRPVAAKVEVKSTPEPYRPRAGAEMLGFSEALSANVTHDSTNVAPLRGLKTGKVLLTEKEKAVSRPYLSESEQMVAKRTEKLLAEKPLLLENEPAWPEVEAPIIPKKPVYRVVHINEIRQRKQQEAKAQSRMALRFGLPAGLEVAAQSDNKLLLSIPIQH